MRLPFRLPLWTGMIVAACGADAPALVNDGGGGARGEAGGASGSAGASGGVACEGPAFDARIDVGDPDADPAHPCAWLNIVPTGDPPSAHLGAAVYDAARRRFLVVGGSNGKDSDPELLDEVWSLSLDGEPFFWTRIEPRLPGPTATDQHPALGRSAVIDGHRLIVYLQTNQPVWVLDLIALANWTILPTAGGISAQLAYGADMMLDEPGRRVVFFGGLAYTGLPAYEPYQLLLSDPALLQDLASQGDAPRLTETNAVYDGPRRRVVAYGDTSWTPTGPPESWALSLCDPPTWTKIAASGAPPPSAARSSAAYDPVGQRLVAFAPGALDRDGNGGGRAGAGPDGGEDLTARVYTLSLTGLPRWQILPTTPGPRFVGQVVVYDEGNDRMLLFGARPFAGASAVDNKDVWELDLASCR